MNRLYYLGCKFRVMCLLVLGREKAALAELHAMLQQWRDDSYA